MTAIYSGAIYSSLFDGSSSKASLGPSKLRVSAEEAEIASEGAGLGTEEA